MVRVGGAVACALLGALSVVGCSTEPVVTTCADFIHADMAERSDMVDAASAHQRFSPEPVPVPTVEELSMWCDAFPDLTIDEVVAQIVGLVFQGVGQLAQQCRRLCA